MEKRGLTLSFSLYFRYINSMVKKVLEYVEKYRMIESGDTIVAGVSGGADSVCLLFMLLEIQKQVPFLIEVVHINHGIRQDAAKDACFVRELCAQRGLPFHLVEEDVKERAKKHGVSQEEEGRAVRYHAFETVLGEKRGKIAVAHNSNDRAETMLFHLFRGTGLTGAGGIRPVNEKIIRPLLCLRRNEIEKWLGTKGLSYCQDCTNEQDLYTRNRIRHHILTYAEQEVCQGAVANMNRAADQLLGAEEYIVRQTKMAMERCVQIKEERNKVIIRIPELLKEDAYIRGRILLESVAMAAGRKKDIAAVHIKSVEALLEGEGNKEIHLPYGITVYKKYELGMIQRKDKEKGDHLLARQEKETYEIPIPISQPVSVRIPGLGVAEFTVFFKKDSQIIPEKTYTKWFDYDKITSSVMFSTKSPGDFLTINRQMGHKSLQDYFVNEKIPKEDRSRLYLLAEGGHVIWIPGYRISEYYKIHKNTRTVLQVTVKVINGCER
ncbi:MAG: tRNA lysidine(34) synthetase TilS [Lachnospiraceae bacterium]|nr:tRNA lysidine(34) synthetase TilS [Lachnospiraceae bacterium]